MPHYGATARRTFIRVLRDVGFEGPLPGGTHEYMVRGVTRVHLRNPHHRGDISVGLLARILRQAGISREEWERLP